MQLVGEVMGQISDALHDNGVPGFDETKLSNDWGRILLEAAGSATIAGATGGNVGAATGSSVAGNIATAGSFSSVYKWAKAQSNGDDRVATILTNSIENAIAGAIGAGAGGAMNGGSGALNGLGISSDLQQYNQAAEPPEEDFRPEDRDENGRLIDPLQEAIWKSDYDTNRRKLSDLCQDCTFLTSPNSVITEQMVNDIVNDLNIAEQLKQSGRDVTSDNIRKVEEWNSRNTPNFSDPTSPLLNNDLFSNPADIAKGDPANYNELPDFPLKNDGVLNEKGNEDDLSLLDEKSKQHILEGESGNSGGHRFGTGRPGKTEFPESWSDQKIENTISDIVTDPETIWRDNPSDSRGYVRTDVHREGLDIRVVYDPNNNRIVTAFPTNTPKNPK